VLTKRGLERLAETLDLLRADPSAAVDIDEILVDSTAYSSGQAVFLDVSKQYTTKWELCLALHEAFENSGDAVLSNRGLWGWITAALLGQVCPRNAGVRRVRSDDFYLLGGRGGTFDFRRYYRHLLATPYRVYRLHRGACGYALLSAQLHVHSDMMEQIASRIEFVTNRGLIEVLDMLYYDAAASGVRRGATDRNRPGSLRRFVTVMQQFELTFDLFGMDAQSIAALLPPEFDEWLRRAA
jgi:hypothetical protein